MTNIHYLVELTDVGPIFEFPKLRCHEVVELWQQVS